jgi:hypothetical protein
VLEHHPRASTDHHPSTTRSHITLADRAGVLMARVSDRAGGIRPPVPTAEVLAAPRREGRGARLTSEVVSATVSQQSTPILPKPRLI